MIRRYLQGGIVPLVNSTYPMARLTHSTYAAPLNYNQPSEVVGGYDAQVDPMTGEEAPQTNFADGGPVEYGEGNAPPAAFYNPLLNSPMVAIEPVPPGERTDDSSRGPTPGQPWINPIDPYHPVPPFGSQTGGIGPYIDMLNQQFAAGPRYGTRTGGGGIPWVNPGDVPVNPQPSTLPPAPTGGSVNPITGGTYTYPVGEGTIDPVQPPPVIPRLPSPGVQLPPVSGEQESEKEKEPEGAAYIEVPDPQTGQLRMWDTSTGNFALPTGGITLPQEPEKERDASASGIEVFNPETGSYTNWDTRTGDFALPTGGITLPQEPPRERGGELVIDTNVEQPGGTFFPETGLTSREMGIYGGATPPQETQEGTDVTAYDTQQLEAAGYPEWEQQLYGLGPYSTSFSGPQAPYNPNDTFANSNMTGQDLTRLGESGSTFGVNPDTKGSGWSYSDILGPRAGISSLIERDPSIYNPSFKDVNSLSDFGDYLVDKLKYAGEYTTAHPWEMMGNVAGALSGIPGGSKAGTVVSNLYGKVTDALKSPNERLADSFIKEHAPEEMSYSDIQKFLGGDTDLTGATASDSGTAAASPAGSDRITVEGLMGNTDLGPGNLTNNYRGTADINAINFLTGAFNGVPYGSPTSMIDMSSMLNPYAAPSAAESAAYNASHPSFYEQNQDLRDYAASHPIGTADPFKENRDQYFAEHPELNPTTGRLYEQEKTPQEIAAAKAVADEYRALQTEAANSPTTDTQSSIPAPGSDEYQSALNDYYAQLYGMNNYAAGGLASLPEYAAGGKLLRGPGDGMSDSIRANISGKQEARLADGEFVIPADVVSHLGNGSTEAGSKRLYEMMDKVRQARTGNKKQGKQINPHKFLPV